MLRDILLVVLGSGLGGGTRYSLSLIFREILPQKFLFISTLSVNLVGSFLLGLLLAYLGSSPHNHWVRLLVAFGFFGGFTSFSCFTNEVIALSKQGDYFLAILYIWCSVGVSLLMISLAHYLYK